MSGPKDDPKDDPKDESDEEPKPGFSLSNILFGNVDKNGELIDGFLDKVCGHYLSLFCNCFAG